MVSDDAAYNETLMKFLAKIDYRQIGLEEIIIY